MDGDVSSLPRLRPERVEPTIPKRQNRRRPNQAFDESLHRENNDEDEDRNDRNTRHRSTSDTRPTPPGADPDKSTDLEETDEEHIDYQA